MVMIALKYLRLLQFIVARAKKKKKEFLFSLNHQALYG